MRRARHQDRRQRGWAESGRLRRGLAVQDHHGRGGGHDETGSHGRGQAPATGEALLLASIDRDAYRASALENTYLDDLQP